MLDSNARACDQSVLQARAIAPPLGCSLVMVRIFRQNVHSRRITPKPRSLMKAAKAAHDALPCPCGRQAAPRMGTSPNKSEMLTGTLPMVGSLCLLGPSSEIWTARDRRKFQRSDDGSDSGRPLMRHIPSSISPLWPGCQRASLRTLHDTSTTANRRHGAADSEIGRTRQRRGDLQRGWLHLLLERVRLCRYPRSAEVIRCASFSDPHGRT